MQGRLACMGSRNFSAVAAGLARAKLYGVFYNARQHLSLVLNSRKRGIIMKQKLLMGLIAAAGFAAPVMAADTSAYGVSQQTPEESKVWRNSNGLCWRTGYWTPAAATRECDPDLFKEEPKPTPVVQAPAPKAPVVEATPAPAPAPAPEVVKITLASKALFAFNNATLTPAGKKAIDAEVLSKLNALQSFEMVLVGGHTDTIGSDNFNQKLSQRRAEAVRQYLAAKGVRAEQLEAKGFGESQPLVKCEKIKARKKLIACQAPNRRVEVEVKGQIVKQPQ